MNNIPDEVLALIIKENLDIWNSCDLRNATILTNEEALVFAANINSMTFPSLYPNGYFILNDDGEYFKAELSHNNTETKKDIMVVWFDLKPLNLEELNEEKNCLYRSSMLSKNDKKFCNL